MAETLIILGVLIFVLDVIITKNITSAGSLFLIATLGCFALVVLTTSEFGYKIQFDKYVGFPFENIVFPYSILGVSFLSTWWLFVLNIKDRKLKTTKRTKLQILSLAKLCNGLSLVLFIGISLACWLLGYVPILSMLNGNMNIQKHLSNIEALPFGLMALTTGVGMVLATIIWELYFSGLRKDVPKITFFTSIVAMLLSSVWQSNRQFFLFLIFSHLATQALTPGFKFKTFIFKFLSLLTILLVYFISAQSIRLNHIGASEFEIIGYATYPMLNLSTIILKHSDNISDSANYILTELVPWRFRSDDYMTKIFPTLFEPTSPSGTLAYWYLDFGNVGVAVCGALLGAVAGLTHMYRSKNLTVARINILVLWCCLTAPIYSHLISLNNFILPGALIVVLGLRYK